jgi:2-desacetyl-2-hydroxyethyl bacteriochlorophyllide A dehydrogenase
MPGVVASPSSLRPSERVVRFLGPRQVDLVPTPPFSPGPGQVRVRTLVSGISAGTELTTYLGTNPYLTRRWDPARRLFLDGTSTAPYPVTGVGYEEVGEVVEIAQGVAGVEIGDLVWGIWGHRTDGLLDANLVRAQLLPPGLDPLVGVFARVGAVALNAVLDADVHIGETVAVFGQGVIGLLATRLAALSGTDVVAVDTSAPRLALAERFGARHTVRTGEQSPAEVVRALTGGRGADVCLEMSGVPAALNEAIRTVGYGGRVIASGFYQGGGGALHLGEEFHHNRVSVVSSQISGVASRHTPRWTRERLHREFMRLVGEGRVDPRPLISAVVPAREVADAFDRLTHNHGDLLQVVLDFREA